MPTCELIMSYQEDEFMRKLAWVFVGLMSLAVIAMFIGIFFGSANG
jgi:hypothetical protein